MIPYSDETERAIDIIDSFYEARGFSYAQLYQQTARYMCKQVLAATNAVEGCPIADQGMYTSTCLDICGSANITWLGFTIDYSLDDICFALNTNLATVFKSAEDTFVLQVRCLTQKRV